MHFITVLGMHNTLTLAKQRNLSNIRKKKAEQNTTLISEKAAKTVSLYRLKTMSSGKSAGPSIKGTVNVVRLSPYFLKVVTVYEYN